MCVTAIVTVLIDHLEYARRTGHTLPLQPKPHPYAGSQSPPDPAGVTPPLTRCVSSPAICLRSFPVVTGEYVRNGGNPANNRDLGRDAHWFDGDGMLSGVASF
ncbi:hypothetical protein NHJ13051_009178 [Beauveria bassiana]